jgi:transcriptional regulator with XRE-family HTH domain
MPTIESHPLRIARIRAGLSAERLGQLAGVSRGAINALEQGRIKRPREAVVIALAKANGVAPELLWGLYSKWLQGFERSSVEALREVEATLSPRARAVLALPPEMVARYGSFKAWRRDVHPSVAGFASLLRVSATSLRRFESGAVSMPKSLMRALMNVLRLDEAYVEVLVALGDDDPLEYARAVARARQRVSRTRERWREEGDPRGGRSAHDVGSMVEFGTVTDVV